MEPITHSQVLELIDTADTVEYDLEQIVDPAERAAYDAMYPIFEG